ncbi:D-alanine--D-alanine ligase [Bacteroidia bacterium]|nr:D-alanine--D-alanine ligase [Bacteroidia bacterium]
MKPNIAIVAGGDSNEKEISLKSAATLYSFMDKERYNVFIVKIIGKEWTVESSENEHLSVDKNDFSFIKNGTKTVFDFAYITIHGTPGENGILQGYFELLRIPYSTSNVLISALTFDKFNCNHFLRAYSFNVAESLLMEFSGDFDLVKTQLGFPCFVKPVSGGSSCGVTKVKSEEELRPAVDKARAECGGGAVMAEQFIKGTEVTCGLYKGSNGYVVFPLSEIVPKNDFFDFDAKYNGQAEEITPARLGEHLTKLIQNDATDIYGILKCKGLVRIDFIIPEENEQACVMLEINITPGMTEASFIPQQIRAAGLNLTDVLTEIIELEFANFAKRKQV